MRLKGVELQGFKSFPDRTKLTFDDGITAIVGPNGSGKSNISDAVKWVLGEQSSKSLRGAKMEDVIFGGTQSRKAMGFAWVSLFIDNSDRSMELDADEVVVTRKLYRSGESEYRINNNLVRLKDIHELFMDTGLGRDGYSVIEQGKIAEIVSAKSTQRREIFEEAAGISKFRYQKTEAERRLQQAEDNLVRLRDILGELEGRVGPLRVQSEKAQQFLRYSEEKKSLELSLWLETLEKLRQQMQQQEDRILVCKSDRNRTQAQLDDIERKIEEIYNSLQDCTIYVDRKRSEVKELEEHLNSAGINVAVKENDMLHNRNTIASLKGELELSSGNSLSTDQQLQEKSVQVAEHTAAAEAKRTQIAALEQSIAEDSAAAATLSSGVEALKMQRNEMRDSIARAKISTETTATLVEETTARMEALRQSMQQKNEDLASLRAEYQQNRAFAETLAEQMEGLSNSITGYDYKLAGKQKDLEALEVRRQSIDRAAGEKLSRAQLLSDLEKNLEGFSNSVKVVMKRASTSELRGVVGPVSSLITASPEHTVAIEIALGAAMQNIVVENEAAAKRAISILKETKTGRCTFLPLTTVQGNPLSEKQLPLQPGYLGLASELVQFEERYRGVVQSVLGRVAVAEDIDAALAIAKTFGYRFRIVTLDGQVVNAGGSLTGGYAGKSGGVLSRKNEIADLTAQARELGQQAKKLEQQSAALSQEVATLQAMRDAVAAESKTASEDAIRAEAESKRLAIALEEAQNREQEALQEFDTLSRRVESLKDQGLSVTQLTQQLSEALEQLLLEIAEKSAALEEAGQRSTRQSEMLSEQKISLAGVEKDLAILQAALRDLENQKVSSQSRLIALEQQIAQLEQHNLQLQAEIDGIHAEAKTGQEKIEAINADIMAKLQEKESLEQKTTMLRHNEKNLSAQRESISGELARLEERLIGMNTENDSIISKMWEEYELTKSQAMELAIPLEDSNAAQRRLGELKNRIRALGTVNVSAIEEYQEVSERYEFLRGQIEDVEKAKVELGRLIVNLSSEMSSIFLEKFQQINRNFSSIFTELFGGGKAHLSLTDEQNVLETGIDIFVQPPGKIIKSLTALSGGEQAFVAICIYFAILKVNPAPFVLIDEIEAALDDVNVAKFAGYLRRMTDRTQFISITHRRGTMEEADVLYGVTMEEEGISKLLKLNVNELESKLKLL